MPKILHACLFYPFATFLTQSQTMRGAKVLKRYQGFFRILGLSEMISENDLGFMTNDYVFLSIRAKFLA